MSTDLSAAISKADQYRRWAEAAEGKAQQAKLPRDIAIWMGIAKHWRMIAAHSDRYGRQNASVGGASVPPIAEPSSVSKQ